MSDFERINGVDGVYVANTADIDAQQGISIPTGLQAVGFLFLEDCGVDVVYVASIADIDVRERISIPAGL